jgi:ATP-dependent helicase HrpA
MTRHPLAEDSPAEGPPAQRPLTERLLSELALASKRLTSRLRPDQALPLAASRYPTVADLTLDAQRAVIQDAVERAGAPRDQAAYDKLRAELRERLEDAAYETLKTASDIIAAAGRVEAAAAQVAEPAVRDSARDIQDHLARLLGDGFLSRAGLRRLKDLRRYVAAEAHRLAKLGTRRALEEQALAELAELGRAVAAAPAAPAEVPWMIEELRVSLFAQELRAAYPVSAKRVRRALAADR